MNGNEEQPRPPSPNGASQATPIELSAEQIAALQAVTTQVGDQAAERIVELTVGRAEELRALFNGVAVVIDDQVHDPSSNISTLVKQIEDGGGNVVKLTDLPGDKYDFGNFVGVSFFVLDWQLRQTLYGDADEEPVRLRISADFERGEVERKVEFLTKVMEHRLAPVFIFTSNDLDSVKTALRETHGLDADGEHSHIMVGSKNDVIEKQVFNVLVDWMHRRPSTYVLKTWERAYEKAKNDMFNDLYTKSVDWPVLLWKTFKDDSLPASDEMGRLITRIIFSRMTPFHINLDEFMTTEKPRDEAEETAYRKKLLAVLEAERFVRNSGLHKDSIAPGDVFKHQGDYWINIRPDCDCVDRDGKGVELYLLKGQVVPAAKLAGLFDPDFGVLRERDKEVVVFAMYDEKTIVFNMGKLEKKFWADLQEKRLGRLLPPYLTRLQQRYASYLQRPGLSRIPNEAVVLTKQQSGELTNVASSVAAVAPGAPRMLDGGSAPHSPGT